MSDKYFKAGVKVVDMAASEGENTNDARGWPNIASAAEQIMNLGRMAANLAGGDGDAEDVKQLKRCIERINAASDDLKRAASNLKPLITER